MNFPGNKNYKPIFFFAGIILISVHLTFAMESEREKATLGGGCFWCTEAVFSRLQGVKSVVPGYSGGDVKNPSYQEVCTGNTGHAEVIQIQFDPQVISFAEILDVFFQVHDPTTLNRQGADVGIQYRSVIFYHSAMQKEIAETVIRRMVEEKLYAAPVVTALNEFKAFYPAEDYHRNYFSRNPGQPYCSFVVAPKVEKFEKLFKDKLIKKD